MVLGKLPVPGLPTNFTNSRARAYIALAVGAGWGCLNIFILLYHFSLLFSSRWDTARYRLKYCFKGPLNLKQPITNHSLCHIFNKLIMVVMVILYIYIEFYNFVLQTSRDVATRRATVFIRNGTERGDNY